MSQVLRNTIRVNLAGTFSLEGDKELFDKIVADQEKYAGPLRPDKVWDLEIGGHDGKHYFHSQQRGETMELGAYDDDRYYQNFSSLEKMLEPFIGNTGLQTVNKDVIQNYYTYLKKIDRLDILHNYFEADGEIRDQARGLLITDLGSIIDVNIISSSLDPAAEQYQILEVGGGYGRLAEAFLNMYGENVKYVLLDAVPASLMYSYLYLSENFPNMRIGFYYRGDPYDMNLFDCYIMPAWHFDGSAHTGSFDCCINVQSMQEMNQYHIDHYLNLFNTLLKEGSGIAYISNEKDYIFRGEWNYPKNWKLLLKTRTPRSWTRNSPTEVFLKSAGSFERENRFMDFVYSLQLQSFDKDTNQLRVIGDLQQRLTESQQQTSTLQQELQKSQQELSTLQQELQKSQQGLSTLQQEVSTLQLERQKLRSEVDSLYWVLARMPLALGEPTIEKTEQSIWFLNDYYRSREHPDVILLFEKTIKINAHLVAANLYLREGRYRSALSHLVQVAKKDLLIFFSLQTIKILVNGLIFRPKKLGRA